MCTNTATPRASGRREAVRLSEDYRVDDAMTHAWPKLQAKIRKYGYSIGPHRYRVPVGTCILQCRSTILSRGLPPSAGAQAGRDVRARRRQSGGDEQLLWELRGPRLQRL